MKTIFPISPNTLRSMLALIAFSFYFYSNAQDGPIGNEWIKYDQDYYKFTINQDGIYRISASDLQTAGIDLSAVDPRNFQLYYRGTEIKVYVEGEDDGTMDANDYIEFFGTFNDGALDSVLFENRNHQPHQYHSLYTPNSTYFLTVGTTNGQRADNFVDLDYSGKTGDDFFQYESVLTFSNIWFASKPFGELAVSSEAGEGEGWMSANVQQLPVEFKLSTPSVYTGVGSTTPRLQILAYGKSDPTGPGAIVGGINHEFEVRIGSSQDLVVSQKHRGYTTLFFDELVNINQLENETSIYCQSIFGAQGRHNVSFIKIEYPRTFDLQGSSTLKLSYNSSNSFISFSNYEAGKSSPIIWDIRNGNRTFGTVSGGNLLANLRTGTETELYISDQSDVKAISGTISKMSFKNINPSASSYTYLMITHKDLLQGADEYKTYRTLPEGGAYNVLMVTTEELYDQFYYGVHHPMALRNFCKFMINNQPTPIENLLLLGRGQSYPRFTFNEFLMESADLVPTMGVPSSDYLLVSGLNGTQLEPAIPVGRVPARDNEDISIYLNKLKEHENGKEEIWRKNVLHLIGGSDDAQNAKFTGYMSNFTSIVADKSLGGDVTNISKSDAVSVDTSQAERVQSNVNAGTSFISYFGHGSALVPEISLGEAKAYKNAGKYPIFYFNGCSLGNDFDETSLLEGFLFEADKGAIGWLAGSTFGFENELNSYTSKFYKNAFQDNYGATLGTINSATIKDHQNPNNNYNRAQCRQFLYFGDPALKFYSPEKADYTPVKEDISIEGLDFVIDGDSVELVVPVLNLGKANDDSLSVLITIHFANNSSKTIPYSYVNSVYNRKNARIKFEYTDKDFVGNVRFNVNLDPDNVIDEFGVEGELNNVVDFNYLFQGQGFSILSPGIDEIIPSLNPILQVQNNDLGNGSSSIYYEIDTTPLFNSPMLIQSGLISGGNINTYAASIPDIDSTDFYWRAKGNEADDEWSVGTFAHINNSGFGWSQRYYSKFQNAELTHLGAERRGIGFTRQPSASFGVETLGKNYPVSGAIRFIWIDDGESFFSIDNHFNGDGMRILFFNPDNAERFNVPSKYNIINIRNWFGRSSSLGDEYEKNYVIGKTNGTYEFNTTLKEDRDSLVDFLNNRVPEGYNILVYSGGDYGMADWEEEVFQAFEQFGSGKIRTLQDGHPYILAGQKGLPIGQAEDVLPNYADPTVVPLESKINLSFTLFPRRTEGSMVSNRIGPAKSWKELYWDHVTPDHADDSFSMSIIGIDQSNNYVKLIDNVNTGKSVDLSSISANLYPQLLLNYYASDPSKRSPLLPDEWTVIFEGVPEGSAGWSGENVASTDTIHAGEVYSFATSFTNIGDISFDSLYTLITISNPNGSVDTLVNAKAKPLVKYQDSIINNIVFNSIGKSGRYVVNINYNHNSEQAEKTLINNSLGKPIYVLRDDENPLFDVVFDGKRIYDREIVSANTVITIKAKDDNEYLPLSNPQLFNVQLKYPNADTFQTITASDNRVEFIAAEDDDAIALFQISNQGLPDGIFTLRANVRDQTGNMASSQDYEIQFEVINESAITNFYPYPNPFTTQSKFVFTLTGSEIPEYINIKILTVTGKVIREINLDELGPLRIGDNITDFAWNGTDQYGDPVGNGVYLYKVTAKLNGEDVKLRQTAGDQFFKNNIGKIYLMR